MQTPRSFVSNEVVCIAYMPMIMLVGSRGNLLILKQGKQIGWLAGHSSGGQGTITKILLLELVGAPKTLKRSKNSSCVGRSRPRKKGKDPEGRRPVT